MTLPRVVMCSMWRNDCKRRLVDRVEHLLAKAETYPALRWLWVVGDSTDDTTQALAQLSVGYPVTIVDIGDTVTLGEDMASGHRRLSETGNEYFTWIDEDDKYALVHESDILSPHDVVNQLVDYARSGLCPVAAWPIINLGGQRLCYDIWALRKDGQRFGNYAPYHACYRADAPFEVDSFGTVFLFNARDAKWLRMQDRAVLDLCAQWKEHGYRLWVAPAIVVEQPVALWQYHRIAEVV